ncbi:MAG: hypothetical protein IJM40_00780, partial [Synergistaceae bacterium]|nr:hypothetical protein [Synergistaceae bacterium]
PASPPRATARNIADEYGSVIILKDDTPRYVLMEIKNENEVKQEISDQELLSSSNKILQRNMRVYQELAK